MERGCGILLHISSLPSKYGIGSFGKSAYDFVDFLRRSGQSYWQVLPLTPTGYGDSPYQSSSAFAVNPYFIDLEILLEKGLLTSQEVQGEAYSGARVEYERLYRTRFRILRKAFERFDVTSEEFVSFCAQHEELCEYALFMALKEHFEGKSWDHWPLPFRSAESEETEAFRKENAKEISFWLFLQYEGYREWFALKKYANDQNVNMIGDMPIYVAYDSVEVWKHPKMFQLDRKKKPKTVAGVPPDCFTADGQLWGNPIYNWRYLKKQGYDWWIKRIGWSLEVFDYVRIDHFRGFAGYYEVNFGRSNARVGKWKKGPSWDLFQHFQGMHIIAEDLGLIDEPVRTLLKRTGYPGMKVLEFAFDGDPKNEHKPTNFDEKYIAYTGTHDNEPLRSYIEAHRDATFDKDLKEQLKRLDISFSGGDALSVASDVIRLLYASRAVLAIVPMQDLLFQGSDCRMNLPSTVSVDNWSYKTKEEDFSSQLAEKLNRLAKKYDREYKTDHE